LSKWADTPPMPSHPCPECRDTTPRYLPATSSHAVLVDYYQCDECGYVFTVDKDELGANPNRAAKPTAQSLEGVPAGRRAS
jgi:hypothetical protein